MTGAWSRVLWVCVWRTLVLVLAGLPARAETGDVAGVRSTSAVLRDLVDDGAWESPTFRGLVRGIAASDGIVYIEEGVCNHSVHACLRLDVTPAAGYRILHILVDLHGVLAHRSRLDLIATIGHELWHASEVLADRSLTSGPAMFLFYTRQAATSNPTFETAGAVAVGQKIRGEVGHGVTFVWQQVALNVPR
jgi:hypothetical protein